ncbi:hypothetical protein SAMN05216169_102038 [Anoxybacillus pushchinoensis]|uniref:Uncharacterized protein n=1 Tax=Anoxybacillus pushchinoensis TaxID=150248 RepID=A0A1I0TBU7_9BACL|nr:hypothetical protein SAMN05216169_102038 [Anoxybacillus pushchinoensis]
MMSKKILYLFFVLIGATVVLFANMKHNIYTFM